MGRPAQKRLVRKRDLELVLSQIEANPLPNAYLEQYTTPSTLAAEVLYLAAYVYDDIIGKTVVELGCGTGRMAIGAVLLGAKEVFGVDLDQAAVRVGQ
jgi:putative methylase